MINYRRRRIIIFLLAALAMILATGAYIMIPGGISSIEVLTSDGERLKETYDVFVGEEVQLECRIEPESFASRAVEYQVADEDILSVDKNGMLTGNKRGETLLTVKCANVRKDINVSVQPSVKEIRGLEKEITLYIDDEHQLEPEVIMAEDSLEVPDIIYKSKRTTVVKVDETGKITAVGEGTTKVTVQAGTILERVQVTVEERSPDNANTVANPTNNNLDTNRTRKSAKKNQSKSTNNNTTTNTTSGSGSGGSGGSSGDSGSSGSGDSGDSGGNSAGDSSGGGEDLGKTGN